MRDVYQIKKGENISKVPKEIANLYPKLFKSQNTKIRTVTIRLDSKITDIRLKGYRDIVSYLEPYERI